MLKQLAIKPVITAPARMTIAEAARAMKQKNVGALIVVNAGRPLGVLTDRDIVVDVVAAGKARDAVRVEDVMRKKPATLREDLGLLDAARFFAKTGVRRLPVVDKAGRVSGIVALDDLMMLLGNEMGLVAGALAAAGSGPRAPRACRAPAADREVLRGPPGRCRHGRSLEPAGSGEGCAEGWPARGRGGARGCPTAGPRGDRKSGVEGK